MFRDEAAIVAEVLGPNVCACHHIGSTAIPGIHAKPIIDMLIEAHDLSDVDARNPAMAAAGYEALGEFGIAGRRYFRKNDTSGTRTHQIHLFAVGSPEIERHLAFRDFMTTRADEARQYSELKQKLAAAHPHDIEAYMAGKDSFIKVMERTALAIVHERPNQTHPIVG